MLVGDGETLTLSDGNVHQHLSASHSLSLSWSNSHRHVRLKIKEVSLCNKGMVLIQDLEFKLLGHLSNKFVQLNLHQVSIEITLPEQLTIARSLPGQDRGPAPPKLNKEASR